METKRIAHLLEQTFHGDPWHGSSVMHILQDITPSQALARPLSQTHNIWEIVLHMTAWRRFTQQKLAGDASYDINTPEQDWPTVLHTDVQAWQQTLSDLQQSQQQLVASVKRLDDVSLDKVVPGRNYTVYVLLQGIIQHDLYHSGQMALLKKQLS